MKPNPDPSKPSPEARLEAEVARPTRPTEAPTYIIRRLKPATVDDLKRTRVVLRREIQGVEERLNAKIDGVESRLDAKIDGVESRLDAKIDKGKTELEGKIDKIGVHIKWILIVLGLFGTLTIGLLSTLLALSLGKG